MGDIEMISIDRLKNHPKNVRRRYEGLQELAESIRAQGILQNLTVVPDPEEAGKYLVVIGNRRLSAARMAGVKELPCAIREMTEHQQVSTMLLENMQRNDLTISEQAQGFQMCLDLGDTQDTLAEKTGFSKTTIRHRLNIAKLDQDTLKKREGDEGFQLTLKDLYELEKVQDIETRNRILKNCASSNDLAFKARLEVRKRKEKEKEGKYIELFRAAGIEAAPKGAENERHSQKWEVLKEYSLSEEEPPKELDMGNTGTQGVMYVRYWNSMAIIRRKEEDRKVRSYKEKEKRRKENRGKLKDLKKEMEAERRSFIQMVTQEDIRPDEDAGKLEKATFLQMAMEGTYLSVRNMAELMTGEYEYGMGTEKKEEIKQIVKDTPLIHMMLAFAERGAEDMDVTDWQGKYDRKTGECLQNLEKILGAFGFSYSREEMQQVADGTHPLYEREGEEDE